MLASPPYFSLDSLFYRLPLLPATGSKGTVLCEAPANLNIPQYTSAITITAAARMDARLFLAQIIIIIINLNNSHNLIVLSRFTVGYQYASILMMRSPFLQSRSQVRTRERASVVTPVHPRHRW